MSRISTDKEKISQILEHNVEDVLIKAHLEKQLFSGKKLRVKLGIDPSGSELHIGHAVVLHKLRAFQELGHTIILVVGSFTGIIGDPTGNTAARRQLSKKDIKENIAQYKKQSGMILDVREAEIVYNDQWLAKMKFEDILKLAGSFTVSQMLDRDMYQERIKKELPISLPEFFYPLMQGYDSVEIKADVELGGTDQLFNVLAGRIIQKHYNIAQQDIITT